MDLLRDELPSPLGRVDVVSDGKAVLGVEFEGHEFRLASLLARYIGPYTLRGARDPGGATSRLRAYFEGDLSAIETLPVVAMGTEFSRQVWAALRTIPVGTTTTYQRIAEAIGRPKACRAVGLANGANPVAIIVPCHRVIGSNAHLTGYRGGLERKQWLLAHEGVMLGGQASASPQARAGVVAAR
ncbi:MAG: methylated-DNA--[protein]-cysteine S-methyltransferase [Planctomycetota bacterium]|nr:methylated-DNA--[protein]-cysteine S-methyltransferase [Planctomycetota bacterium]